MIPAISYSDITADSTDRAPGADSVKLGETAGEAFLQQAARAAGKMTTPPANDGNAQSPSKPARPAETDDIAGADDPEDLPAQSVLTPVDSTDTSVESADVLSYQQALGKLRTEKTDSTDSAAENTNASISGSGASDTAGNPISGADTSDAVGNSASGADASVTVTSDQSSKTGSQNLDSLFEEAGETYHVSPLLLKAIAMKESNLTNGLTSPAGAKGIMQLMPATAKGLGVTDAMDARQNIMGGAKLISSHLSKYSGNLDLALAAYNAGSGNVAKYGGVPPFRETKDYIAGVRKNLTALSSGSAGVSAATGDNVWSGSSVGSAGGSSTSAPVTAEISSTGTSGGSSLDDTEEAFSNIVQKLYDTLREMDPKELSQLLQLLISMRIGASQDSGDSEEDGSLSGSLLGTGSFLL